MFANQDAAETWFEEHDPEGVASNTRLLSERGRYPDSPRNIATTANPTGTRPATITHALNNRSSAMARTPSRRAAYSVGNFWRVRFVPKRIWRGLITARRCWRRCLPVVAQARSSRGGSRGSRGSCGEVGPSRFCFVDLAQDKATPPSVETVAGGARSLPREGTSKIPNTYSSSCSAKGSPENGPPGAVLGTNAG